MFFNPFLWFQHEAISIGLLLDLLIHYRSCTQFKVWHLASKLITPSKYDVHRNWGMVSKHPSGACVDAVVAEELK